MGQSAGGTRTRKSMTLAVARVALAFVFIHIPLCVYVADQLAYADCSAMARFFRATLSTLPTGKVGNSITSVMDLGIL